ncbi:hypothetical protein [Legionella fallonii]|uniref:Uncharacterized protein n=1 Tax=Legionella fallonii LLAP-10 TaxID=1212491 RepID=A0A098G5C1_9GAMM|nr:hypothetical protein [Legionella fallonii]CEG57688.1 protein of unknown function [Legionella fallonii LLAP-10]
MSKNSLNTQYISWLTRFMERSSEYSVKGIVRPLITGLSTATSLEELLQAIQRHPPLKSDEPSSSSPVVYGPINLHDQLSKWQKQLQEAVNKYPAAKKTLTELLEKQQFPLPLLPLIVLLNKIINTSKFQLHCRIFSLIAHLSAEEEFLEVLDFIASLKETPQLPKESLPSGSFLAQNPINTNHQQCLALLNTVATQYNEKNKLSGLANGLLQDSLLIYQETLSEETDLSYEVRLSCQEEKEETQQVIVNNYCVLF